MKKFAVFLLTLFLLLSLTGCGDALSKLLDRDKSPDTVQGKEPDIPGVPASSGGGTANDPPVVERDPTAPSDFTEPAGTVSEPDDTPDEPAGGAGNKTDVKASHKDVSLFSAGETFTMSAKGVSGVYASTFTSQNPEVAEVDETTGEITAVSPGMTTVTMHVECEDGQFDFDCIVRCRWEAELPGKEGAEQPSEPSTQPPAPSSSPSLSDFFAALQENYEGLGRMTVMDKPLLDSYYPGLSGLAAVEEVLIQESAISISNVAVGLVKLSDSATVEDILAVQSILQSRITAQANGGAFYPESCEVWENGVITSASNCVGMFVYPDGVHAMATLFTDTFGS